MGCGEDICDGAAVGLVFLTRTRGTNDLLQQEDPPELIQVNMGPAAARISKARRKRASSSRVNSVRQRIQQAERQCLVTREDAMVILSKAILPEAIGLPRRGECRP